MVVTNNSTIPVTLTSLVDSVFGDLNGVGSCNRSTAPANLYGTMAPNGTYSCTFSELLGASNAGLTHVNKVTASVTSDGGPATAFARATVTYSDVSPDISVTKTADVSSFAAAGGLEVVGFTADGPDAIFARTSGGGGGGSVTPIFYGEICDTQGANDQPAQSDMDCFSRADNVTGYLTVRWTWDDINSWTGSGQTGDACALLDTDGNGSANYSFCARITNPDPTHVELVAGSPILYGCKDKANDRCSSPISVKILESTSTCTISLVDEHFAAGEDGHDTQAECKLKLSNLPGNLGIENVSLVNVCSFPSGSRRLACPRSERTCTGPASG